VFQLNPQAQKIVGSKVQLHIARDPSDNSLKIVVTNANKVSEFKFSLENVSLPDKITLHKQSAEILYVELLQLAINHSKALKRIDQLEQRLKHEKTASKSHQKHIKALEVDIVAENADQANVKALHKLLDNKDKTINDLKEKLKIPPTQVLQTTELTKAESEIDILQQRILHLHTQICSLKHENETLSGKLPGALNTANPLEYGLEKII